MRLSEISISLQSALLFGEMAFCVLLTVLVLLAAIRQDRTAGYYLAAFLLLSALYLVPWAAGHLGWYADPRRRDILFYVPFQQLLLIGPCIYLYVSDLIGVKRREVVLHFIPGLLYLGYSLVVWLTDTFFRDTYYFYADGLDKDLAPWYQMAGLISLTAYALLTYRLYHRYRSVIRDEVSYSDAITFAWVRRFLVILVCTVVVRLGFLVAYPGFGNFGQNFWYYLIYGVISCTVALAGYTEMVRQEASANLPVPDLADAEAAITDGEAAYADISDADLDDWKARLDELMVVRELYRDPSLSLGDLADRLELNRRQTSAVINRRCGKNFNDYVNGHRVEVVLASLRRGDHRSRTLLALALDAGFNSKSTFNRVFKRETGRTPRQLIASLPEK